MLTQMDTHGPQGTQGGGEEPQGAGQEQQANSKAYWPTPGQTDRDVREQDAPNGAATQAHQIQEARPEGGPTSQQRII